VRTLPEDEQRVLHGIYRQGRTYQEVADDTGIPLGTLKRRLRSALATLRERLGAARSAEPSTTDLPDAMDAPRGSGRR
jgi:RNA polymerase sigma-70 factor (ECF subfamily)